jgi:hypothetical protein
MKDNRLSRLSSAFRDVPLTVGSHTLRPITAGTVMLLMDTGNMLFSETETEPTEAQAMQALFEFMWIHVGPEDEVIRQCEDPAVLRSAARAFALGVSFEDLDSFSTQFSNVRNNINAALVDVIPEKGEATKKPDSAMPTPTGSPPLCTVSEAVETQSVNTGSSGNSPSSGPSNTSTLPTPQTDPKPAGRSPIWEAPPSPPDQEEDLENVIPIG